MKSKSIIKEVEDLGRIMIPKEYRDVLGWRAKMPVAFYCDEKNNEIILRKHGCMFCNGSAETVSYRGKMVCRQCLEELNMGEHDGLELQKDRA